MGININTWMTLTWGKYQIAGDIPWVLLSKHDDFKRTNFILGRNDCGQLGMSDSKRRDLPEIVPTLDGLNIVNAATGKNHTLFLTGNR